MYLYVQPKAFFYIPAKEKVPFKVDFSQGSFDLWNMLRDT